MTLSPPANSRLPPLSIWAIYAREVGYPADVKEPIDWMLLTTVKTESFEDARQRLSWYGRRWGIEVYHRIIKSGCRIEDRRLDDTDSLEACPDDYSWLSVVNPKSTPSEWLAVDLGVGEIAAMALALENPDRVVAA